MKTKQKFLDVLRWSEKYTKTDMVYLAKGGFWLTLEKIGIYLTSFAIMVAFANWVPPDIYGTYQYVLSILAILAVFSLPGINTSFVRSIAREKDGTLSLAVKTKIKWGLLGTLGLLGVSVWYFIHQNALLGTAFLVGGMLMPFKESLHLFSLFWNGKRRFDLHTKYKLVVELSVAAILLPVLYLTNNIILMILVFYGSQVLSNGFFLLLTLKRTNNNETEPETISFGKNLTLMGAVRTVAKYLDRIIIWSFLGPIPVAVYSFAKMPFATINRLNFIQPLALPKISRQDLKKPKTKEKLLEKFRKLFLLTALLTVIVAVLAPFFYEIFFPQYLDSVPYFQVLVLLLLATPFILLETALISEMKKRELYIIKITFPLIEIILFLALTPLYGIWGIIAGRITSQFLQGAMTLYFFKKI